MRRILGICVLMMTLSLTACGGGTDGEMELALAIRQELLAARGCDAVMEVTADHGQRVHTFTVAVSQRGDSTSLTVLAPESVAGIQAQLEGTDSALCFGDIVLDTGPLDGEGLSVLQAMPTLLQAAREGYIDSCALEQEDGLQVVCRQPELERGQGRQVSIWFDPDSHAPLRGEILWEGRRVILCTIERFVLTDGAQ